MIRYVKILTAFLLIGMFPGVSAELVAGEAVQEIIKAGKKADRKKYPDSDTVLLYNIEKIRYDAKGLSVSTDEYYQKVLTEAGRKSLRRMDFHFNKTYGTIEIQKLEILRGGKKITLDPKSNSRITVDSSQMGSNIYDPANKILSLSVPHLEIGDIVGIKLKRHTVKARIPGFWGNYIALQGNMPILRYIVEIDGPADLPLKSIAVKDKAGTGVKFSREQKNGRIHYRWEAVNVPQAIPEPDMPAMYSCVQRLLVGTAAGWGEISQWYYRLCRPQLDKIDDAMKAKVRELTKACKTEDEKIHALFQFVSQKIRYMGLTPESEAPGYEPHDVRLTFHNRYGVCRDKAALLVALLEEAGLKAYPVLIMAGVPKDDDVPNGYFNHAITAVEKTPGKYILMDPTNESARELLPATLGNCSYLVAKPQGDKLRRTPSPEARANEVVIKSDSVLDGNGTLKGKITLTFTGVNDMIYRDAFSRWSPEEVEQYFSRSLQRAVPGAELTRIDIRPRPVRDMSKMLKVTLAYTAENVLAAGGAPSGLQLPELGDSVGASGFLLGSFALEKRRFKLQLASTFSVRESYTLRLPCHVKLLALPEKRELGKADQVWWSRKFDYKNQVLSGSRVFLVNTLELTPEQYARARDVLKKMDMYKKALPVITLDYSRVKAQEMSRVFEGAEMAVLKNTVKYTLKNSHSYQEERVRHVRVLNYSGVKSAGEVKVSYNPVWETVEISGEVISPSGKKHVLGAGEKNVMDAPWNASAPRYPGEKILVANFPGVEIGSEIRYRITRHVRQRQFFSAVLTFAEHAPVLAQSVEIDMPSRQNLRYSVLPEGVTFSERNDGSRKKLVWRAGNTPRVTREAGQAPLRTFVPTVFVSSGKWQDRANGVESFLRANSLPEKNPRSAKLAAELVKALPREGNKKERQLRQVRALRDFSAKYIRQAGPGLDELPLGTLSAADETLKAGYGRSADRAIQLAAMLQSLDIPVEFLPVSGLLYEDGTIRRLERFPQMVFGDVLLYLPTLGIYLNDTSQYAYPGAVNTSDRVMFSLKNRRLEAMRELLRYESRIKKEIKVELSADGTAVLHIKNSYYGSHFESANRLFAELTPELEKRHFSSVAASFSRAAEITGTPQKDFDSYPGIVQYTVRIPGFACKTGGYFAFDLPEFHLFSRMTGPVRKLRKTPFVRRSGVRLDIKYDIILPRGWSVTDRRTAKMSLGDYTIGSFVRDYSTRPGRLLLDCRLKLPAGIIPAVDFDKLFTLKQILARPHTGRIILIPNTGGKK